MNVQKNNKPPALKGWFKRGTAIVMAVAMIVTAPAPGMSFVSRADTRAGTLPKNGGTDSTAYIFDQDRGPQVYGVFDLQGIKDPDRVGSSEPYMRPASLGTDVKTYQKSVSTTRGYSGFFMSLRGSAGLSNVENLTNGNGSTATFNNQGVELKISAYPDDIHNAIIFEYTMKNLKDVENTVDWSTYANIRLGALAPEGSDYNPSKDPADASKLSISNRGFYMRNESTKQTFECITDDADMGLDRPNTRWVGVQTYMLENRFNNSSASFVENVDSAMAYSYQFVLGPKATETKKIAFRVNNSSYYVSENGRDSNPGTYVEPFRTVDAAIAEIKAETANTTKVANIYFQGDYQMDQSVVIPDGYTITIRSTDYNRNGGFNTDVFTVIRPPGDNKPMFKTGQSGGIHLTDITLDGGGVSNSAPMVSGVGSSTVTIDKQATLQNNNLAGAGASTGSAVAIFDHAKLKLNSCSIINNNCEARTNPDNPDDPANLHNSAVYFANQDVFTPDPPTDLISPFTMEGPVQIDGNTRTDGTKANVYLADAVKNQFITVTGDMIGAKLGIASSVLPDLSSPPRAANQSVMVVRSKVVKYSPVVDLSKIKDSFYADQQGEPGHPGIYTAVTGSGMGTKIVLKRGSFNMSFAVKPEAGAPPIASPPAIAPLTYEAGVSVTTPPAPDLKGKGYKLSRTVFTPEAPALKADPATGVITGTMPSNNVKVDYYYKELKSSITFHTNSGTPADIPKWEGQAGTDTGKTAPTVSKTGYKFLGWSRENNGPSSPLVASGFFDKYPSDEIDVYAIYEVDPGVTFDFNVKYINEDESLTLKPDRETEHKNADAGVSASPPQVKGFTYQNARTDPASTGTFDPNGNYTAQMPNQNLTVYYRYAPDTSRPQTYNFTVNYKTMGGIKLAESVTEHPPLNGLISASPLKTIPAHYSYSSYRIDQGGEDKQTPDGWVYGVKGTADAEGNWSAKMPNQDVVLTYIYEANKDPDTGKPPVKIISESYLDDKTKDPRLADIKPVKESSHEVDAGVAGAYTPVYGYTEAPDKRELTSDSSLPQDLLNQTIRFDGSGSYTGVMPNGNVVIKYHHNRDASQWKDITYKPGKHGALKDDPADRMSQDVTVQADGTYQTQVLLTGNGANETGYTWKDVKDRLLVPGYAAHTHYRFAGWFVDANNDGVYNQGDGDRLMKAADKFLTTDGIPIVVTASFEKIPSEWMDIDFGVEKGQYDHGDLKLNVPKTGADGQKTLTWGELKQSYTLPANTPWPHYVKDAANNDGWFMRTGTAAPYTYTKMEDTTPLNVDPAVKVTYIQKFIPDTAETHTITQKYKNEDGTLTFGTDVPAAQPIEKELTLPAAGVPGYTIVPDKSTTLPAGFRFDPNGAAEPLGTFGADGTFRGKMPGENLEVNYSYKVDPAKTRTLTVKRVSDNGVDLGGFTKQVPGEEKILIAKASPVSGYVPNSTPYVITQGGASAPGSYLTTVTALGSESTGDGDSWTFGMPNQDVTIVLKYHGDTAAPHTITEKYIDTGSSDPALQNLPSKEQKNVIPDTRVNGSYKEPYGYSKDGQGIITYLPDDSSVNPDTIKPHDIAFDAADANAWSGHMPGADVEITYNNRRITSDWVKLTYKSGANGSLSMDGVSADVTAVPGSTPLEYETSVLKDGGAGKGYDLDTIGVKKLNPNPVPLDSTLYRFDGWYEDTNGDGTPDHKVAGTEKFTKDTVLTAIFKENSDKWIDITFRAEHGTLDAPSSDITHVPDNWTWSDIYDKLPNCTPWPSYTAPDKSTAWYAKGSSVPVKPDDPLSAGMEYTFQCVPDPAKTYAYTVKYMNRNNDTPFVFKEKGPEQKPVDDPLNETPLSVPGYVWDKAASQNALVAYDPDGPDGPEPAKQPGTFDDQGNFTGKMPGQDLAVIYYYNLDTTPQAEKYKLTVQYQSEKGATIKEAEPKDLSLSPESNINQPSADIPHYTCVGYRIDAGQKEGEGLQKLQAEPAAAGDGTYTWNAKMPNQDVTLTYLYKGDGAETSKFNVTEKYMDVTDPAHPKLISSDVVLKDIPVDQNVEGDYRQPYGYVPGTFTIGTQGVLTNIEFGTGDASGHWSGVMPAGNVTITYNNTRNDTPVVPGKPMWAAMTYKKDSQDTQEANGHGTLTAAADQDLETTDGGKTYSTQIRISDGTAEGEAGAYTWKTLKEKNLIPTAQPENEFYALKGWYIDKDNSGTETSGDVFLGKGDGQDPPGADETKFHGDTTLIAVFYEIPEKWIDITFQTENGTYVSGNQALHRKSGTTWGQMQGQLPVYTPWAHFEEDGWYEQGKNGAPDVKMDDPNQALEDGSVYIHRFKPSSASEADKFSYMIDYSTTADSDGDGRPDLVFKTVGDPHTKDHIIKEDVQAQPIEVPGYTLDKDNTMTTPRTYPFDGTHDETFGSFDPATGNYSGHMPGQDLTVHYKYKLKTDPQDPDVKNYTLTVKYQSLTGIPLAEDHTESLMPESPIQVSPVGVTDYTCTGFEFTAGKTQTGEGIAIAPGEPDLNHGYQWDSRMPNQDVTLIYKYTGDQSITYNVTEKYIDTGTAGLQEIAGTGGVAPYHLDESVNGEYQAPSGYQPDPSRPFTIEPAGKGISFDPEDPADPAKTTWSGHMPNQAVTITYYSQRIKGNPDDPAHPYWGDITYLPGTNGTLSMGASGEVSPDVTPTVTAQGRNGYKANILLDNADAPRPEAYTWGDIRTKKLVPKPEAEAYYKFMVWYEDNNGNGLIDDGDAPLPESDTDPATFKKPATLIASFEKDTSQWFNINFGVESGTWKNGAPQPMSVHDNQTWQEIENRLPESTPWDGYVEDGWYNGAGHLMTGGDVLTKGEVYTHRYKPDPNVIFDYTVEYTNEDGSVVFKTIPAVLHRLNAEVEAERENIPGYDWDQNASTTDPEQYIFDPAAGPLDIGQFDPATGHFSGHMPKSPLKVIYKYKLKDHQDPTAVPYHLKVNYQTVDSQTGAGTDIHQPYTAQLYPEDAVTGRNGGPVQPEEVDGYKMKAFRFETGKADHDGSGNLLQPVQGEPDPNHGWQWTSRMPNQDVTLTYIYEVDQTKTYGITQRYVDEDAPADIQDILPPAALGRYPAGAGVNGSYEQPYGYTRTGQNAQVDPGWDVWDTAPTITFNSGDGSWSGTMPPRNTTITYTNQRNQDKWSTITYKLGNQNLGSLSGDETHVTPSGADYTASILMNDGTSPGAADQSYTLGDIRAKKLAPKTLPNTYYQFKGWFVDKDGDGIMNNGETVVPDTQTFNGPVTLTACFEKNPDQWFDIHFEGEHAAIDDSTKNTLNIPYDKKWGDLAPDKLNLLPAYTPEVNCLEDGWYDGSTKMTGDMPLQAGHTYTIVYYQDPEIFGTNVKTPEASGGLDSQGKGKVTIYNTSESSYNYILTDMDGKVLAVVPRRSLTQRVEFGGLGLGTRYNVYEADRKLVVQPGEPIQGKGEEGKTISGPAQVLTPVLDGNYQVYPDEGSEDEAKTKLSIYPADYDSEYALVDSRGQVVQIPGAQEGGWITPSKVSALQIPGLDYEMEYTVVARPKGQTDITPQSRLPEGSVITTDPVGDLNLKEYIIQTTQGQVEQVGETQVGADSYNKATKGDKVILSAEKTNDAGEAFTRWNTTIGTLEGQTVRTYQEGSLEKISFDMPGTNLVMTPVYEHRPNKASPSNALVKDEVRGGNREEIALDPETAPDKEVEVTKTKDRELMDKNKAEVDYHVVYRKGRVKPREVEAVQSSNDYDQGHLSAFHAAWSLNISVERYVNGRRVELEGPSVATANNARPSDATPSNARRSHPKPSGATPSNATPSDAAPPDEGAGADALTFRTYVQMGKGDVDMLDYQLYEITEDENGNLTADLVVPENDPAETGGLFAFTAKEGTRYVMVYSRAYRVHFINELPLLAAPQYYDFKVRRMDRPDDPGYAPYYEYIPEPEPYLVNLKSGAEYYYQDWSYSGNTLKSFKPDRPIKSTTYVYAYYEDNEDRVAKEREKLKETIEKAWELSEDPFLKRQDRKDLRAKIEMALGVFQQGPPEDERRAFESELKAAREALLERMKYYQDLIKQTHEEYEDIQSGSGGGGSGGGGGGGKGVVKDPFNATPAKSYTVGTNGNWHIVSEVPGQEKELAFILNGGMALRSMWARLKFPDKPDSSGWYHFNSKGILDTGWFVDEAGKWYYSNKETEGYMGKMAAGWHKDALDGRWFYLDPVNGDMATGWKQIDGKWYYLEPVGGGTYVYNGAKSKWNYAGGSGHPLGSMYQNEMTPEGYKVDENGAWIQ